MSSYSASAATRRGSVVPPLAGVDRPTVEQAPDHCDVLITGTGLVQSILAAALAWQGTNVLHIDQNSYYGSANAILNVEQLKSWVLDANNGVQKSFSNAKLYIPRPLDSKKYLIDISPKIMFARSDMLDLLLKSRVFQYLEFKSLGSIHTYEEDNFERVPDSKEDIFTNQSLTLETKRYLMKFMKFALDWESQPAVWESYKDKSITEFLSTQFKLDSQQVVEIAVAIGLCNSLDIPTPTGLARIKRYLTSLDIYGNFPILYSMYGSAGELAQGFSRSAAVGGATYKLDTKIKSYDPKTKTAVLSDGASVFVSEKVVSNEIDQDGKVKAAAAATDSTAELSYVTRLVSIVTKDCKEWFSENESACVVVFPPGTLTTNNKIAVQVIIMGSGTGCCPDGQAIWYLSTTEVNSRQAEIDLEEALSKLEASILRESTEDFEFTDISESDIVYKDGMSVLSSVKLGQSFKHYVPKEKLQFILKLSYRQEVQPVPTINSIIKLVEAPVIIGPDAPKVLETPLDLAEISYDGIVLQAKKLYERIVGSDDDFFDVDFEDEDERAAGTTPATGALDDDVHMGEPDQHDEIGDQMEL